MCTVISLIKEVFASNNYGQRISTKTKREIFASTKSITRSEFDAAGRQGLNPSLVFITPKCNYDGEELLEYNSKIYRIYRTYDVYDDIELYVEERSGSNETE